MESDEDTWAEEDELRATCRRLAQSHDGIFTFERDIISPPTEEAEVYYASIGTARGEYTGEGPTLRDAMLALIKKLA
jgi:hypothetical protein